MASLFFMNGCEKSEETKTPELTMEKTEFMAIAAGEVVSVPFKLENVSDGLVVTVTPTVEYNWAEVTKVGSESVEITVQKNDKTEPRSAIFNISYPGTTDAKFVINQVSSEYDYIYEMTEFTSTWYAETYRGENESYNYYTFISDLPFDDDGFTQIGGTYYLFDIYAGAPADETAPVIPAGKYTLGEPGRTAEWTFTQQKSKSMRYDKYGMEWGVSFKDGTMTVSYEGSLLTIDALLIDIRDKTHHVTYKGEAVCIIDRPEAPREPGFGEDVDIKPVCGAAECLFDLEPTMHVGMVFLDQMPDDQGKVTPPAYALNIQAWMKLDRFGKITTGTYNVAESGKPTDLLVTPGAGSEEEGGYRGSYVLKYVPDYKKPLISLITGGTMTIEKGSGSNYIFTFDFVGNDGKKITGSWSGPLKVENVPGAPFSTLKGDYTLNLKGATATASMYGDTYENGGNNWVIKIMPENGVQTDGFMVDFVTESGDFSAGIPSGRYQDAENSKSPEIGQYITGYKKDGKIGGTVFVGGFNETGAATQYAPASFGSMYITNNGDGTYLIELDFTDDKWNNWNGEWSGKISLVDKTAGITSLAADSSISGKSLIEVEAQNLETKSISIISMKNLKANFAASQKKFMPRNKVAE